MRESSLSGRLATVGLSTGADQRRPGALRHLNVPRLLVLGGGAVSKGLHLPALARMGWLDRAAVLEISPRVGDDLRRLFPGLTVRADDYREALANPRVKGEFDGVVITLPNHLHEESVRLSLQAGLPVLCEKPLATDREGCLKMAALAAELKLPLSVAMVRRVIPWVGVVRRALRTGLIGNFESLRVEHGGKFQWPVESDIYFTREHGGILVNMGVHYLDMIEDWLGPLSPMRYEDDFAGGVEANFELELRTIEGAKVELALSYTHALKNEVAIEGSKGRIRADVNSFDCCTWESFDTDATAELSAKTPFRSGDWPRDFVSCFIEQFYEFALVIEGRESPRVAAPAAAESLGLVEWAYANRRKIFDFPGTRPETRPGLEHGLAVVTGATGFVGGKLVERLADLGFDRIRVPVRSVRTSANVCRFPVERVIADLIDAERVRAVMKGARYVFHLAYGASGEDAGRTTRLATKNVVDAAIAEGAEAVVVVSTATVFGHPKTDRPIDESFPYRPALGEYGGSKADAERYALEQAKAQSKTRIVVISPSAVYGPSGPLFTELPARMARAGQFCWIEEGRGKLNYVFVDNLVDALMLAAQNPRVHGERFLISDGVTTFRRFLTPLLGTYAEGLRSFPKRQLLEMEQGNRSSWRDLLRAITNEEVMLVANSLPALARPKKFIEKRLAGFYANVQGKRREMREGAQAAANAPAPAAPPAWLADIFGPLEIEYSAKKAESVLGWKPRVDLEEGLRASVDWLKYTGLYCAAEERAAVGCRVE